MSKEKAKKKVKLPCDSTGEPIHVNDVLGWGDGTRMKVAALNYYGKGLWNAEGEDGDFSDNLEAATIVWRKGEK